jgi:hypothetical protein
VGLGNFVGESINGCKFELQQFVKERGVRRERI